jgi:hypothetical protein
MRRFGGKRTYLWAAAILLAAGVAVGPAPAAAVESCVYDAVSKTATAAIADGSTATLVVSGGAIHFGTTPTACGAATTANTDSISIAGNAGTNETLILDHRGGVFGPGATAESNIPEIEIATSLGDASDRVVVYGTNGPDYFAAGQNGFARNSDGDLDVTFAPAAFMLEVHVLDGDDYFNGRGEGGAGLHFLGPIVTSGGEGNDFLRGSSDPDALDGGPGNDELRGQELADVMDGGPGVDLIGGGDGNDTMTGGPGADRFLGSAGNDVMFARDGEIDTEINGGQDSDLAHIDAADPAPLATETSIRPSESCNFNGISRSLTLEMTPGSAATLVVVGGAIHWGTIPQACGAATTTNVDTITITGAAGTVETLILDQRGGVFGPGATPEHNTPEIEIDTNLGDTTDRVIIYGTEDRDVMAAGQNGVATSEDGDVDFTFAPNTFHLEFHVLGGDDHVDARGTGGAGLKFLGPTVLTGGDGSESLLRGGDDADVIDGGSGDDLIDAQGGDDVLRGGPGDDRIGGGGDADSIDGGPGIDTMNGSDGDDTFLAQDGMADASISGGGGADTAYIDTGIDPAPVTVETVIGSDTPPPAPVVGCVYDTANNTVTATMAAGGSAKLVVVGDAIHFGAVPAACGAATTTNTSSLVVKGTAGSVETVHLDLSGGLFAPGTSSEATGASEIEISLLLGDATDHVVVTGTADPDTISVGTNGISYTTDADVDVTFSPVPATVEVIGLGGVNALSGRGGFGAGTDFPNKVILRAGDAGDTLTGGNGSDELHGGAGNDNLSGRNGDDTLDGGGGGDTLAGNVGLDTLIGGAGADSLIGGDGDDTLRADDDEADSLLNGGPGTDTAHFDQGIDPTLLAIEVAIPA